MDMEIEQLGTDNKWWEQDLARMIVSRYNALNIKLAGIVTSYPLNTFADKEHKMSSRNHTSKKRKDKPQIADGGLFASMALDMPIESAVQYQMDFGIRDHFDIWHEQRGYPKFPIVYFVQDQGPGQFIKIGYSSKFSLRISALRVNNPYGVKLIAFLPGDESLETAIQDRFVAYLHSGEWYHPAQSLLDFIDDECQKFDNKED